MAHEKERAAMLETVIGIELRGHEHELDKSKKWLLASPCGTARSIAELLAKFIHSIGETVHHYMAGRKD